MKNKIFVGGLPWGVDNQTLGEFFSQYGEVTEAIVITDRENDNKSKGFGFVTFKEDIAEDIVQKTNGIDFDGRKVTVKVALPRKDH